MKKTIIFAAFVCFSMGLHAQSDKTESKEKEEAVEIQPKQERVSTTEQNQVKRIDKPIRINRATFEKAEQEKKISNAAEPVENKEIKKETPKTEK
jgi:hypothetical protein